jgi:hypothetical protein
MAGCFTCSICRLALTLWFGWRDAVSKAREFIDFWIENSIHAAEQYRVAGASQDVAELTHRMVEAAGGQGISEDDLRAEIGDIADYIRDQLTAVNRVESERRKPA